MEWWHVKKVVGSREVLFLIENRVRVGFQIEMH